MNERIEPGAIEPTEQQAQVVVPAGVGEAVGTAVLTAATNSEPVIALDLQAPRSWDLHKSGW